MFEGMKTLVGSLGYGCPFLREEVRLLQTEQRRVGDGMSSTLDILLS